MLCVRCNANERRSMCRIVNAKTTENLDVAEYGYEMPSSRSVARALPNPSPQGKESQNSCPLSLMERARVRVKSVLHGSIQQRQNSLILLLSDTPSTICLPDPIPRFTTRLQTTERTRRLQN